MSIDINSLQAGDIIRATKGTTVIEGELYANSRIMSLPLTIREMEEEVYFLNADGWTIELIKAFEGGRPLPEQDGLYASSAAAHIEGRSLAYATIYRRVGGLWWDATGTRRVEPEAQHVHNNSPLILLGSAQ